MVARLCVARHSTADVRDSDVGGNADAATGANVSVLDSLSPCGCVVRCTGEDRPRYGDHLAWS
jgi:hypothetical protein